MKKHLFPLLLLLLLSSCHVGRYFVWNFADIRDHKKFASLEIENSDSIFFFEKSANKFSGPSIYENNRKIPFEKALEISSSRAFLVIQKDSILYEQYFAGYDSSSIVPSFSVAKSFTSALVGIAIDEGFIKSVDDPLSKYIPELPQNPYAAISIRDLLDMRSGLKYEENYINPFGHVAKSYYGTNLKKSISKLKAYAAAGSEFDYISVNTQLLGWAVENAVGKKLNVYLEEKIWKPLGMEYPASWSVDSKKHKTVKAFCCINTVARDYAKFGRLYLKAGNWNGKQLISENWIKTSLDFDETAHYSYQWWRRPRKETGQEDFFAMGILGQFIYVNPKKDLIIVRLGKGQGGIYWPKVFQDISDMY